MKKAMFLLVLVVLTMNCWIGSSDELFEGEEVPEFCQNVSAKKLPVRFWWLGEERTTFSGVRAVKNGFLVMGSTTADDPEDRVSFIAKFNPEKFDDPLWVRTFSTDTGGEEKHLRSLEEIVDGNELLFLTKTVSFDKVGFDFLKHNESFWVEKLDDIAGSYVCESCLITDQEVILRSIKQRDVEYEIIVRHRHYGYKKWLTTVFVVNKDCVVTAKTYSDTL